MMCRNQIKPLQQFKSWSFHQCAWPNKNNVLFQSNVTYVIFGVCRSIHPPRIEEAGPILFTKPRANIPPQESLHLSFAGIDGQAMAGKGVTSERSKLGQRIELHLSKDVLRNIFSNRDRFTDHLKRISTQSVGRFNPWALAEE